MNRSEVIERRKNERFQAQENTFVRPSSNSQRYWKIIDISKGGLAFRYVSKGREKWDRSHELDIVKRSTSRDTLYSVRKIPFENVSDFEIVQEPVSYFAVRRYSVQFGKITDYQISRLEAFIPSHTLAEAQ